MSATTREDIPTLEVMILHPPLFIMSPWSIQFIFIVIVKMTVFQHIFFELNYLHMRNLKNKPLIASQEHFHLSFGDGKAEKRVIWLHYY
jgi:hypothetical protein